jgi:hypothetical protein
MQNSNDDLINLKKVYLSYTNNSEDMQTKQYIKLFKDSKIIDKTFSMNDADIIFSKVKILKSITFKQFIEILDLTAKRKKTTKEKLIQKILLKGNVSYNGTKTDYVKFHDDKSTYTGVYAKGGPSTVDAGNTMISDISQLCDRTEADVRGVKTSIKK